MATLRASRAWTRRQFLVRSTSSLAVACARKATHQPRRRSPADRRRHSVRRCLGWLRRDLGARRPARAHAGGMLDRRELQDHHRDGFARRAARGRFHRKAAARTICRPGRTSSIASRFEDIATGIAGESAVGHFRTAPADGARSRSCGPAMSRGRAGASTSRAAASQLSHHARQPSGLLHPLRRSHLCRLHRFRPSRSCRTARSGATS